MMGASQKLGSLSREFLSRRKACVQRTPKNLSNEVENKVSMIGGSGKTARKDQDMRVRVILAVKP